MKQNRSIRYKMKTTWLLVLMILVDACVERIDFDVPPAQFQMVIEGTITDSPGPYTVKVTTALSINQDSSLVTSVENANILLIDDEGNEEDLVEVSPGTYVTGGIIQGQVGHAYHVVVKTENGKIFESAPDTLKSVGAVENIRYEFESRVIKQPYGEVQADVFNVYVDADAGEGENNYMRWRFTGTYKVLTYPQFHLTYYRDYVPYKSPPPCSGYVLVGGPGGGLLVQVGPCECCTCWAKQFESLPQLSDMQLISGSKFKNVKVGEVPISNATFFEKYMVEIEQMSLSRNSFDFFKLIRAQKLGASSLFQPPSGEIRGNIKAVNNHDPVVGLFWATSIKKKSIFIYPSDIPYRVPPIEYITDDCSTSYPNSSTTKPTSWD